VLFSDGRPTQRYLLLPVVTVTLPTRITTTTGWPVGYPSGRLVEGYRYLLFVEQGATLFLTIRWETVAVLPGKPFVGGATTTWRTYNYYLPIVSDRHCGEFYPGRTNMVNDLPNL